MSLISRFKENSNLLWKVGLSVSLVLAILLALYLLFYLLGNLASIISILFFGAVLSFLLHPFVNLLARFIPRTLAVLVSLITFLAIFVVIFYFLTPTIVQQLLILRDNIPILIDYLQQLMGDLDRFLNSLGIGLSLSLVSQQLTAYLQGAIANIVSQALAFGVSLIALIVQIFLVLLVAFFFSRDWPRIKERALVFLGRRWKRLNKELLNALSTTISRYVLALILSASVVGVLIATGTTILGVSYSWILGIIAFFGEFVPYLGPIFSAGAAVILSLGRPPLFLLYLVLFYIVVQALQNYLISPAIMSKRMGFHPLLVILAVLAGGVLFGFWGAILAVPIVSIIRKAWELLSLKEALPLNPDTPKREECHDKPRTED